jgi:hypothetical protein
MSGQALKAATPTSQPSTSGHPVDPQDSVGCLFVGRAPDDFWPITLIDTALVAQQSVPLASPSNLTDSVKAQKPLVPHPAAHTVATPSQQSFSSELLTVSFLYKFQLRMKKPKHSQQLSSQDLPRHQAQNLGMFNQAENFSATGTFIYGNGESYFLHNLPLSILTLLPVTYSSATSDRCKH